jgi:hypothetical protein
VAAPRSSEPARQSMTSAGKGSRVVLRFMAIVERRLTSARTAAIALLTSIAALASMALAPAPASAASIVFMKGGNVWLASPDGSAQRQVTTGGGWDSPSQADDGTILAQNGTQLFRLDPHGKQLAPAIDTLFTGAPVAAGVGPINTVISPDGVNQAFDGEINANPYYDAGCNCYVYNHRFATWWGSASTFSAPNQTLGQQDYVDPAWIDNGHLMFSAVGILIAQVATYAVGGGDNTMTPWFSDSDPNVQMLGSGAITRGADKLAFVANVSGGVGNEIRIYATNGPPPVAGGPAQSMPTDQCNIGPNNFQSLRVSFAPDGQSLAYDAPDGIHLVTLAGFPSCASLTDSLIIPGGTEPSFGPADVPPSTLTPPPIQTRPPILTPPPAPAFSITHRHVARNGAITLLLTAKAAGTFAARASAVGISHTKHGSHGKHKRFSYGSGWAMNVPGQSVKLTIKPTSSATRALKRAGQALVSITIKFAPTAGSSRTIYASVPITAPRATRG